MELIFNFLNKSCQVFQKILTTYLLFSSPPLFCVEIVIPAHSQVLQYFQHSTLKWGRGHNFRNWTWIMSMIVVREMMRKIQRTHHLYFYMFLHENIAIGKKSGS